MKKLLTALVVSSVLAGCATGARVSEAQRLEMYRQMAGAPVESFRYLGTIQGWTPLGDEALVVRAGVNQSYLLELMGTCPELDFATAISISNQMGRVYARFDTVRPLGGMPGPNIPCRIGQIRPVDARAVREAEREMRDQVEVVERDQEAGGT
ncbi:MAG: DUF6491 family protein [Pseudomonadota bacterium]|nr:DUF6491 family protein [Pseudomonadota bacterium]